MLDNKSEKLILKLPFGYRDVFPVEAKERKCIEDIIRYEFESWCYGEVKTPVVEFTENISFGVGKTWKDKLISFFDIDGNLISLRADMTVPIARLAGMRLKKSQLPARFYYIANSFRQSGIQKGQKRVLNQAGLEFIGINDLSADVEVLAILVRILKNLSIENFRIALSHTGFLGGITKWFTLDRQDAEFIKKRMIEKNFVELKDFLGKKDKSKTEIFLKLIEPTKDLENINYYFKRVDSKFLADSLNYIVDVYKVLEKLGFKDKFILDLGTVKDFEYYSGLLFEVYCPKISCIIGSGGRYDGLIKKFGLDVAGTGFALDVDLLHKSLRNLNVSINTKTKWIILAGLNTKIADLIDFSQKLIDRGFTVELMPVDSAGSCKLKAGQNPDFLYFADFETGKVKIKDFGDGSEKLVKLKDFLQV